MQALGALLCLACLACLCGAKGCRLPVKRLHGRQLQQFAEASTVSKWQGGTWANTNASDVGGGCLGFPGFVTPGQDLGSTDSWQPTFEACCNACHELAACNAFVWCGEEGGCYQSARNYSAQYGDCWLLQQPQSLPELGRPMLALEAPGFTGGAPIRIVAPDIPGYDKYLGLGYFGMHEYGCAGTLDKTNQACALPGSPEAHAAQCNADPLCLGMTYFPNGREYGDFDITVFKGGLGMAALNLSEAVFNPNSVLYINVSKNETIAAATEGSSGGLSTAAVAGIVVGACCGLGLLAALGLMIVKRRRQRKQQHAEKQEERDSGKEVASSSGQAVQQQRAGEGQGSSQSVISKPQMPASLQERLADRKPSDSAESHPSPATTAFMQRLHSHPLAAALSWSALKDTEQPLFEECRSSAESTAAMQRLHYRLEDDWHSCVIDINSIHWCTTPQGARHKLGVGAFATVYRVLLDGVQPHAAKVIDLGDDPVVQDNFIKEATMLRKLRHRNMVGFTGVCVSEGQGIIVMELMDGGDLRSRLQFTNRTGERVFAWYNRGRTVALDVARALHYLHSLKYTHFDVKAKNVLLTRELAGKLGDVGFVRVLQHTHHSVSSSATGTFDYMAPELLLGRQCNSSVDVYSYGVLLWEICTGEFPSRGCLRALRVPEECPQEVAALFLHCVEEDPSRRPTAREVVERLSHIPH